MSLTNLSDVLNRHAVVPSLQGTGSRSEMHKKEKSHCILDGFLDRRGTLYIHFSASNRFCNRFSSKLSYYIHYVE